MSAVTERPPVVELVRICLDQMLSDGEVLGCWHRWRQGASSLDDITVGERELLTMAWARVVAAGGSDAEEPRLLGLRRQAGVRSAVSLTRLSAAQRELANVGIQSAVIGDAAAVVLAYRDTSVRVVARPMLLVEYQRRRAAAPILAGSGVSMTTRLGLGAIGLSRRPAVATKSMQWQGHPLQVASPAAVAYPMIMATAARQRPGSIQHLRWLVDVVKLARSPGFDPAEFASLACQRGWAGVVQAHLVPWTGVGADRELDGLIDALTAGGGPRTTARMAPVTARALPSLVGIGVRVKRSSAAPRGSAA